MALEAAFNLPPKKAIEFFRKKGYAVSFAWQDQWNEEHNNAFTVAKMLDVDLLRDVRAAVDQAMVDGLTFEQFRKQLEPVLQAAGWWGRQEVTDPDTGEIKIAELGSPRRLRTIYRTNMATAYAAGHWQKIEETKQEAGYLLYDAVDDNRTRPEHAAWDGTILPVDDPWWSFHTPPNGWNCRCSVIQLSKEQAVAMGYNPDEGAPSMQLKPYMNPRTGELTQVPEGVDPGFGYNPGTLRGKELQEALAQKLREFKNGR